MNDQTKRLTISVPEAGRRLGIGRNASYEAAAFFYLVSTALQR